MSAGGPYGNAAGCPTNSTTASCTVTGLSDGTTYFFQVAAINGLGTGAYSAPSNGVTPAAVPGMPANVTGTAGNGQVAVAWTAPASSGGSAITGYQVQLATSVNGQYSNAAGCPANSTTTSCTVTGLSNGTTYVFRVAAINGLGTGLYSTPSNGVTPVGVPGTPTNVRGTAGNGQVAVSWAAPASNGGSAITGYQVQLATRAGGPYSSAGCPANSTTTSCTATGLNNGTTYYFRVAAINSVGTGAYSAPSSGVTPRRNR
jgi:predicted phage tail protein